ncbi:MAG: epoxide hydrolase, partial [Betaproteobacteria bacterium]|nr:epoxide hydrolase [Betaproteobacteria bacterium]
MTKEPFTLHVSDSEIADLKLRLARARLPDQAPGAPWSYGTDLSYMRGLIDYWQTGFDWRAQEARLNALPQVMVPIDGINIHTLHVPGKGPKPMPLLLLHGWPGSVFEFLDIIARLTDPAAFGGDPADAFTVVAPSLPGYGLSFSPGQKRFGIRQIADSCAELMSSLGYSRFGVQGGDWGAAIATSLSLHHPDRLIGMHLNFLSAIRRDPALYRDPSPEVQDFVAQLKQFSAEETGYQLIQGTKPQTLAFALTDSPVGLAAWFVEKFRTWTDCGGEPETALSRDQMLADISFY